MIKNPDFELFKNEFPEVYESFGSVYQSVSSNALDEKTKQLVYLGVLPANRYAPAIRVHIAKALEVGATPEEIQGAIMLSIPAGGICDFFAILPEIINGLKKECKGEEVNE
ncbi:carboxymuconolactone decarboxylase family protein [Bacillus sp. BP-3]|uniref:carboxymuconolactone decarboxylase family protein n=1 Tax=Bacillus sp. BP-3 TaxID=3022773 RepID=UPI00232BAF3C|nr:carboxymuconolactone decarboxylase family protein [Bacillus sp. BP-3]MDC2863150.1 carboxymuconolactone decarboxylase family protein [Bacillus sp. BP-3]